MKQVPLERDIDIAVNGCYVLATSAQKGTFAAMMISRSRGTCFRNVLEYEAYSKIDVADE